MGFTLLRVKVQSSAPGWHTDQCRLQRGLNLTEFVSKLRLFMSSTFTIKAECLQGTTMIDIGSPKGCLAVLKWFVLRIERPLSWRMIGNEMRRARRLSNSPGEDPFILQRADYSAELRGPTRRLDRCPEKISCRRIEMKKEVGSR
jgi:hypothetical protein